MTDHRMQLAGVVQQWDSEAVAAEMPEQLYIATQAARWGADQELEACCAWVQGFRQCGDALRIARRPKPPSLKKQACDALDTYVYGNPNSQDKERTYNTIRRALERLAELEGLQDA